MRAARTADGRRFLEVADSMRLEVLRFTERVTFSDGGGDGRDSPGRESELRTAIEELRAQNESLVEACRRLEREMAKYRDLYDASPDPLVTTDVRGVIEDANVAAALLVHIPQQMLPGLLLISFVARADTRAFRHSLHAIVGGPGQGAFSVRVRPRGGTPLPAHFSVRAVRAQGLPGGVPSRATVALHWTIRPIDPAT